MLKDLPPAPATAAAKAITKTVFPILLAISFSHLLNDTMQSLIPSTYPLLKRSLKLDFSQLGLITFCFQLTASLLQPFVGMYTDKKPLPYSLAAGMCFTGAGTGPVITRRQLPHRSGFGSPRGHRFIYLSSGSLPAGLPGFRRTPRHGPICFPGRRKRGCVAGPSPGRPDRCSLWPI